MLAADVSVTPSSMPNPAGPEDQAVPVRVLDGVFFCCLRTSYLESRDNPTRLNPANITVACWELSCSSCGSALIVSALLSSDSFFRSTLELSGIIRSKQDASAYPRRMKVRKRDRRASDISDFLTGGNFRNPPTIARMNPWALLCGLSNIRF